VVRDEGEPPLRTRGEPGLRPFRFGPTERRRTGDDRRTKKQKVEAFLTHVTVHEVGHTLGLRHNFAGSLDNQSSVMEYIDDVEAVDVGRDHPGPYDAAAIRFLYGLSPNVPTSLFCTDEDTRVDPDCAQFDTGAQPLVDSAAPTISSSSMPS